MGIGIESGIFSLFGHFLNPLLGEGDSKAPSTHPTTPLMGLLTYPPLFVRSLRTTPKVKHESPQTII